MLTPLIMSGLQNSPKWSLTWSLLTLLNNYQPDKRTYPNSTISATTWQKTR